MKFLFFKGIVFVFALFLVPVFVFAGAEHNLQGWGWSSTIGWISFNSTNDHDPNVSGVQASSINYGVNKENNGDLVGYAWSPNIGWIKFGGLSGFPSGSATYPHDATVLGSQIKGWAKALSADANGWDGWISFSGGGSSDGYGVSLTDNLFSGYAWGSGLVGWIYIYVIDTTQPNNPTNNANTPVFPGVTDPGSSGTSPDATLNIKSGGVSLVGSTTVPYGVIPTFEWTLSGLSSGTSCTVSAESGPTTISFLPLTGLVASGSRVADSGLFQGSYSYRILCAGGSTPVNKTVTFSVIPEIAAFSLTGPATAPIIFTGSIGESQLQNIYVSPNTTFLASHPPVSISITPPATVASTTIEYSINNGAYSTNPSPVVISNPYSTPLQFKARVTLQTGAPSFTRKPVTLTGVASGVWTSTKTIFIEPSVLSPGYGEF